MLQPLQDKIRAYNDENKQYVPENDSPILLSTWL